VRICAILVFLCADQWVSASLRRNNDESTTLLARKIDVDRQGVIGTSLLGGPLALAAFLFSLPLLPALLIAPIAIAGIRPAIGAVNTFMSAFGGSGGSSGFGSFLAGALNPGSSEAASSSSGSQTSTSGSGSGSGSTFSNALRGISDLLFSRRHQSSQHLQQSQQQSSQQQNQQLDSSTTKPDQSANSPSNSRFGTLVTSIKDIYGIVKSGLRRYEITDTDCQSRIICEVHQKAVARSLRSFTSTILDYIGIENLMDNSNAFNSRAKDAIKDFVKAAKNGLSNNDCALVYYRCPSSIPVEQSPIKLFNDYLKQKPQNFDINQFIQNKVIPPIHKPNRLRPAIKSAIVTSPRTVNYYSNINKL